MSIYESKSRFKRKCPQANTLLGIYIEAKFIQIRNICWWEFIFRSNDLSEIDFHLDYFLNWNYLKPSFYHSCYLPQRFVTRYRKFYNFVNSVIENPP